jgi:hypothetical protein
MEALVQIEFKVPTSDPNPDRPAGCEMNAVIPVVVQFTAAAEGTHMIDFYIDERYQQGRSIPFRIRGAVPQQ